MLLPQVLKGAMGPKVVRKRNTSPKAMLSANQQKSHEVAKTSKLRGPAAILFISRNTCSDSIAKLFRACFVRGIAHELRDTLQNGVSHRCACVELSIKRGIAPFWGFQRGIFVRGGISTIRVVHAPVAKYNFVFFVRGLLIESFLNSEIFAEI